MKKNKFLTIILLSILPFISYSQQNIFEKLSGYFLYIQDYKYFPPDINHEPFSQSFFFYLGDTLPNRIFNFQGDISCLFTENSYAINVRKGGFKKDVNSDSIYTNIDNIIKKLKKYSDTAISYVENDYYVSNCPFCTNHDIDVTRINEFGGVIIIIYEGSLNAFYSRKIPFIDCFDKRILLNEFMYFWDDPKNNINIVSISYFFPKIKKWTFDIDKRNINMYYNFK